MDFSSIGRPLGNPQPSIKGSMEATSRFETANFHLEFGPEALGKAVVL